MNKILSLVLVEILILSSSFVPSLVRHSGGPWSNPGSLASSELWSGGGMRFFPYFLTFESHFRGSWCL
jgi:hypothetical protein